MRSVIFGLLAILGLSSVSAFAACEDWTSYKGILLRRLPGDKAYVYQTTRIAIDADGAPNAYQPQDRGIDALANAGFPKGDWKSVLVTDPADPSRPFVQDTGQFAGFFLSMTTLQDRTKANTDPARWVDARTVPYLVFPGRFFAMRGTGRLGVLGMARSLSTKSTSPVIFADVGGQDHELGEVSIRLAENLGGHDIDPRSGAGAPKGPFVYIIFPGTEVTPPWPLSAEELQHRTDTELAKIGGWDAVLSCLEPH
jgi:hypothetical protein